jgi:hypothetical protein
VTPSHLDYGASTNTLYLLLDFADCEEEVHIELEPTESWIVPMQPQGLNLGGSEAEIPVRILRDQLAPGLNTGQIIVETSTGDFTFETIIEVSALGPRSSGPNGFRTP